MVVGSAVSIGAPMTPIAPPTSWDHNCGVVGGGPGKLACPFVHLPGHPCPERLNAKHTSFGPGGANGCRAPLVPWPAALVGIWDHGAEPMATKSGAQTPDFR